MPQNNEKKTKPDLFGFLPYRWTIEFDGGSVSPVSEYDEAEAWVKEHTNPDGFLYPPLVRQVKWDLWTNESEEEVPRTRRPALLHRLPASHILHLSDHGTPEELQRGPGAFIIHLLGYLFETRLQFGDWWFDGRVPVQQPRNFITKATAQDFLSHCYRTWRGWAQKEQRLITNVLYMHSRAPSYEWDWERFTIEYMVLDGCWKLAELQHVVKAKKQKHKERIHILCQKFGIPFNDDLVRKIVGLRNDLFHETLWDDSQPCTAASKDAFQLPDNLRRLNQRIIPAVLGYKTPFIQTGWWLRDIFSFDQPSKAGGT